MARSDRDVYRGTHKNDWTDKYYDEDSFRGTVPSYRKRLVRKSERAAVRRAMQRGDYESAISKSRKASIMHTIEVLDW